MTSELRHEAGPKARLGAVVLYAFALVALQALVIDTGLRPSENAIWLYNGIASLLFGSRLLNPYFTPPLDALTNAFAALTSMIAAALAVGPQTVDAQVLTAVIAYLTIILLLALVALLSRPEKGQESSLFVSAVDRLSRQLGNPTSIFTIVIIASVWLFHRDRPSEVIAIVCAYAIIAIVQPLEGVFSFARWLNGQVRQTFPTKVIGPVAAYQTPNIALVRQANDTFIARGSTLLVGGEEGKWLLGVALNYVGRDERNLLRVLTTKLPQQLTGHASLVSVKPTAGVAVSLEIPPEQVENIPALEWISRMCGIVDSDTTSEFLRLEVIEDKGLSEGRLVEVRIGEQRSVLFQLVEGITHEEIVQQKNKYGYARATARKIGRWDAASNSFVHVPWLPRLNAPVFLREEGEYEPRADAIGHFPKTSYGVSINTSELVTHNTAILGILGVGKSYLAVELIERMIADGIKVLALDLTNQYANLLGDFLDPAFEEAQRAELAAAGTGGVPNRNREQGGSVNVFKAAVIQQLTDFMTPENGRFLRVLNPSQFLVTKQAGGMFNNDAELMSLTVSEITGIFSDAALTVCQQLGMTEEARLCLVYEEAHSLVPEWNSVASAGDDKATAVSARAILQGRKYGLGCLLITQRTANVTKSILNQCNTVFAMRMFDETGKGFLANYLGSDFAAVLSTLEPRHAVLFGRASCCDNPVLLQLNDRAAFLATFRAEHPPVAPAAAVVAPQAGDPPAAEPPAVDDGFQDLDDDVPF